MSQPQQIAFIGYNPPALAQMPVRERPTERIVHYGVAAVSMVELLAALVGGQHQMEIACNLANKYKSLLAIRRTSVHELTQIKHLGTAAAARLNAAAELGRRLLLEHPHDRPQITSPAVAANLVQLEMAVLEQEQVRILILDTRNRVLNIVTVYQGSLNTSLVRIGELFKDAIRQNAAAIIAVHNHPSGDPTPSPEDVRLTEMLVEAGKLLDVEFLDHLIIGQGRFVSLKEKGLGFR